MVAIYGFQLSDGSFPERDATQLQKVDPEQAEASGFPYGDSELDGFVEWWEEDSTTGYGPHYLHNHPGESIGLEWAALLALGSAECVRRRRSQRS